MADASFNAWRSYLRGLAKPALSFFAG
ncbi:MAG: hypothetical protein RLZZ57_2701, partial [Pseudomonadota bacterium]